jgi:TonB family protein
MRAIWIGLAATLVLAASAAAQTQHVVVNPDWLRRPTAQEMAAVWPEEAARQGVTQGRVVISCAVTVDGKLSDCTVNEETPVGAGLGAAALKLSDSILMKPQTIDGKAVGGAKVTIPVSFVKPAGSAADEHISNQAQGWIAPKNEDAALRAGWPHGPNGRLMYGSVLLDCAAANGHADDCTVKGSQPASPLLESAALALAPLYATKDISKTRRPLKLSIIFDTPPNWLKKPDLNEMLAVYPAKGGGRAGFAQIDCIVKTDGLLRDCKVAQERPANAGFGTSALGLAPTFLMKPAIREGEPIETEVSIPITFEARESSAAHAQTVLVVTTPVWAQTPTIPEILAELDKKVGDKFADGKVTFQCTIAKKTGKLSDCINVTTSPGMVGFRGAAQALTSKFVVDKEYMANAKDEVRVNLAFSFPDMQSATWSKRYLLHPVWLRTVSPDPNQPLFPEAAAKAGLKTGFATVDCVLSSTGALTNCSVVSESNPGLGFGEMAEKIAQVFVANPWTEDGLPADGAHVKMPIKMNYDPATDSPPAAPAPTPATKP